MSNVSEEPAASETLVPVFQATVRHIPKERDFHTLTKGTEQVNSAVAVVFRRYRFEARAEHWLSRQTLSLFKTVLSDRTPEIWQPLFPRHFPFPSDYSSSRLVGFEVLTSMVMKSSVLGDITQCIPLKVNWHFRGTCRLHLQGCRKSQARNQHESGRN
jgi:hypothetical protein